MSKKKTILDNQLSFEENIINSVENSLAKEPKILSIPPLLTILTLPYREPKDLDGERSTKYEKTVIKNQTTYHLSIKSGYSHNEFKKPVFYGIPYGIYPRLLLYYICSEVNKTKQKEIYLGDSYKEILENLHIKDSNGKSNINGAIIKNFKNQLNRLLNAQIIASKSTKGEKSEEIETNYLNLVDKIKQVKFWNEQENKEDEGYVVKLTEEFYKLVINQGATVFDYKLISLLKNSPIALDLALFLNYWAYGCMKFKKDLHISYKSLYEQFGSISSQKHFNSNIKKAIKQVCQVLPNLFIKLDVARGGEKGLLLMETSRPLVASKQKGFMYVEDADKTKKINKDK